MSTNVVTINPNNNTNGSANGLPTNTIHVIQSREPPMRMRSFSMSSTRSGGSSEGTSPPMSTVGENNSPEFRRMFFSDKRERRSSGSIFSRRADYSSFNTLPRHKINSYHIKMEDDGNHGNDETRCFILSTLSANKMNRTACVICSGTMIIFDRYPLIDGTFFLSPRQHNKSAVPVHIEGRVLFMNAVCMGCLEGMPFKQNIPKHYWHTELWTSIWVSIPLSFSVLFCFSSQELIHCIKRDKHLIHIFVFRLRFQCNSIEFVFWVKNKFLLHLTFEPNKQ